MTREALNKLNEKQMEYCKTLSFIINRAKSNGLKDDFERSSGKLRGFLECLCQMGVIKGVELRVLYMWFWEKDRNGDQHDKL